MRTATVNALVSELSRQRTANPRIVASGNAAVPWSLLKLADTALDGFRLFMLNAPVGIPAREGVAHETPFVGAGMRDSRSLSYFPCRLGLVPRLLREAVHPDVVLLNVSLPRRGKVSLGTEVNILPAAIEVARSRGGIVIAQLNASMPYTHGDSEIDLSDLDFAIEVDEPLIEHQPRAISRVHEAIGANISALVEDEATLQTGIGAIPDAVLMSLRSRTGLRIFSEMISDGVWQLSATGALATEPIVTSFAMGSADFYGWLDDNGDVAFRRTELTNSLACISAQPAMTSINAAIEVDLDAQVNATYVRGRPYSGFGGQSDFVEGALHAERGLALIALPSWHDKSGCSTIVRRLQVPATSFQPSHVVTDRGTARIWGLGVAEQRSGLARIADPRAVEVLTS